MGDNGRHTARTAREIIGQMAPYTWPVPVYGLTGSIGSGKSELGRMLAGLGADLIDADRVGHELLRRGRACHGPVIELFGRRVLGPGGRIDRERLAGIVFGDAAARRGLEQIMHPAILRSIDRRVRIRSRRGSQMVIVEAALLVESGMDRFVDGVIVVLTSARVQLERLLQKRGMPPSEARRRMGAQWSPERKAAGARWVIANDGTLDDLGRRAGRLFVQLSRAARLR